MSGSNNGVTLKALANVSPGFALKPWVQKCQREIVRNPEESVGLFGLQEHLVYFLGTPHNFFRSDC